MSQGWGQLPPADPQFEALELGQLVTVYVIDSLVPAAGKKNGLTNFAAIRLLPLAMLEKSAEWSNPCARSNHDDRRRWSEGQFKLRTTNEYWNGR